MEARQVHCPFCNAAQAVGSSGDRVCDFCLQPFSVVDAQREEGKLLEEIKAWVQQKIGTSGGGGVDTSSRAFIFQQKLFPELRRDVDRSLEALGGYAQFPLVVPPLRASGAAPGANPLVSSRAAILALKKLRARLSSEQVSTFSVVDTDKAAIAAMDARLAQLMYQSNIAEASAGATAEGYAAARRNLEVLLAEVTAQLISTGQRNAEETVFLGASKIRYEGLVELCRLFEEVLSSAGLIGTPIAERLDSLADRLAAAADQIEQSNHTPAESMPLVLGIQQEVQGCRVAAKYLRACDAFTPRRPVPFASLAAELELLAPQNLPSAEDVIEACALAVRAERGEVAISFGTDFSWVNAWVEGTRAKKALGMFGKEELVAGVDQFFVPAWIADVQFSRAAGAVFRSGQEAHCLALVEACAPGPAKVVISAEGNEQLGQALASSQQFNGGQIALPRSSAAQGRAAIEAAVRGRADMLSPSVKLRGLGLFPMAVAHLTSKGGEREVAACMAGLIPVDAGARHQWLAAKELKQRLS